MVVEDNSWAITTPAGNQWGGSLVEWAKGGGVYAEEVDGADTMATYEAAYRLAEHVRSGQGPVLMHLQLGLLDAHSSSTDIKAYRTKEEIEYTTATKDPVKNLGAGSSNTTICRKAILTAFAKRCGPNSTLLKARYSLSRNRRLSV